MVCFNQNTTEKSAASEKKPRYIHTYNHFYKQTHKN